MIGKKTRELINEQIKNELESAYLYWAMEAYFRKEGWDGFGQWMRVQATEELSHAEKFYHYLNERGSPVELKNLNILKTSWSSVTETFQDAYKHEQFITSKINDLVKFAREENDNASYAMLQWFVNEQVEEESNASKIVQTLERIGEKSGAVYHLDHQLAKRTFGGKAE